MKPDIYLHIPTPCHEDWDKMTPVAKGKFCSGCNKEVVDFSLLSDTEVLNFFKKSTGNTCGRFYSDQLQRPLREVKIEKKKGWQWVIAGLTSLLMVARSYAQKTSRDTVEFNASSFAKKPSCEPLFTGKVAVEKPKEPVKPVARPGITLGGISWKPAVQNIPKPAIQPKKVNLYAKKETKAATAKVLIGDTVMMPGKDIIKQEIKPQPPQKPVMQLPQSTSNVSEVCDPMIAGGLSFIETPKLVKYTPVTRAAAVVRKVVDTVTGNSNAIVIYPNPAVKNSIVHVVVKDAGAYAVELFDNNSRLLHVQENSTNTKLQTVDLQLPAGLNTGLHYIRMVNKRTKKMYTNRIVVL